MSSDRLERAMRTGILLRPLSVPLDEPATQPENPVALSRAGVELRPAPILLPAPAPAPAEEPAPAPVPTPAPIPEPPPMRPMHRRAARRVLRLFRPLALPFLHRLDWRIRGAVDRTEASAAVTRIEAALASLAASADAANAANTARLDATDARADAMDGRLAARLDALEMVRLGDHAELLRAVAEARVPDEVFAGIVLRLDTARLQIRDVISAGAASAGATDAALAAVRALTGEAIALLGSLHPKADNLGLQLSALHVKVDQAASDGTAEQLGAVLASTDALLRRNLVPAGPDVAVRTDDGYVIVPIEDESQIVAMVEAAGRLESGALSVACALAVEGGLAVDVGAHLGTFTVPLAHRVGPRGLVVAVEPTPRTADALRRTLALNGLQDRVALHECAAGGEEGRGRLHVAKVGSHNSLLPLGDEGVGEVEVVVRTLDAVVPEGRPAGVVKIDAEGMELEVLRGAGRVLAESPRVGVVAEFGPSHLARVGVPVADWLGAFQAHGFTPWEIEEATGLLRPLRTAGLDAVFSLNLLWLRDSPESYAGLLLA